MQLAILIQVSVGLKPAVVRPDLEMHGILRMPVEGMPENTCVRRATVLGMKVTLSMSLYNVGDTLFANFPSFTEVDDDDD